MKLILQIALGVSLGIVLGGSVLYVYKGAFTEQLISAALKQTAVQNTPSQAKTNITDNLLAGSAPQSVAPNPVEPTTPQQISETPIPPAETKTIAEVKVNGQSIISGSLTEAEEQQKAAKFKEFYQKSEKCVSPNEHHALLVACGNEHIRAKAKFEELWQQGKFKN